MDYRKIIHWWAGGALALGLCVVTLSCSDPTDLEQLPGDLGQAADSGAPDSSAQPPDKAVQPPDKAVQPPDQRVDASPTHDAPVSDLPLPPDARLSEGGVPTCFSGGKLMPKWKASATVPYQNVTDLMGEGGKLLMVMERHYAGSSALGYLLSFDGKAYTNITPPGLTAVWDVWSSPASGTWVLGDTSTVGPPAVYPTLKRRSASGWDSWTLPTTHKLEFNNAVWAASATEVFLSGPIIRHFNGKSITKSHTVPNSWPGMISVHGSGAKDVYAAGTLLGGAGSVMRWDGAAWKKLSLGASPPQQLWSVWTLGPGQVYAVGSGGAVLRRLSSGAWQKMNTGVTSTLYGIWGSGAKDLWAVGDKGVILRHDGKSFRPACFKVASTVRLNAVWGDGKGKVWVGGTGATLIQF